MADDVRITNLPDSGSPEAVALEIWRYLRDSKSSPDHQLKFYTRCVTAVRSNDPSYYDLFQ